MDDDEIHGDDFTDADLGPTAEHALARDTLAALLDGQTPEGRMRLATAAARMAQVDRDGGHVCDECGVRVADMRTHAAWHGTVNTVMRAALGLAPLPDPISALGREFRAVLDDLPNRPALSVVRDDVDALDAARRASRDLHPSTYQPGEHP